MVGLKGLHGDRTTRAVFYTAVMDDDAFHPGRAQPRPRLRGCPRPPLFSRYVVHESRQWHGATGETHGLRNARALGGENPYEGVDVAASVAS